MPGGPDRYDELYVYAMGRDPTSFILQHVVDAHAAQTATRQTKPPTLVFALAGLYLHVERGLSGKQVQRIHMRMGRRKTQWPALVLPRDRGAISPADVLAAPAGGDRDRAIDSWCRSVWDAFRENRETIVEVLKNTASCNEPLT
ncbi:MAG TPA: DUF5946 family protein [Vicinamibacterales bacterium]|jgi:hypothetical protein|nr:DUF5946 family protein [Vicinamibacterales bacterium]